jgi:hypothetical protein
VVGLLLVSGLLPAGPAAAHVFSKLDGNDSSGKLDLRSAAVSHTSTSVVHRISTYNAWTPRSLGNDSFFVIQIDKNNDRNYERCAFIFYTKRLRGSLSNCGARFIRYLPVAKLSGTAARVTIPKSETGGVYWWGAVSLWDGPRPCTRGCVDFAPNRFPDILHDLNPPVITMSTSELRVWDSSTTTTFLFPFSVSDTNSGVRAWLVQRRVLFSSDWATVASGVGGGSHNLTVTEGPGRYDYRVTAFDKQGNQKVGPIRRVSVPTDDLDLEPGAFTGNLITQSDDEAFGGSYTGLDVGSTFAYADEGCLFELIGPGSGTWIVTVTIGGQVQPDPITAPGGGQRQTIFSSDSCNQPYEFIVDSGTGFGVDAVLAARP